MRLNDDIAVPTPADAGARRAAGIVRRVFRDYPGEIAVRLWNGETLNFGAGAPDVTLVFHRPGLFRDLILFRDPLRMAEAYFQGELDVEGDIYAALRLKDHLKSLNLSAAEQAAFLLGALFPGRIRRRSIAMFRRAGANRFPAGSRPGIPGRATARPLPSTTMFPTRSTGCGSTNR